MATYSLIGSVTVATSTAEINFNSIPQTYTDLILKISDHIAVAAQTQTYSYMRLNGVTSANYYNVSFYGRNSTALSIEDFGNTYFFDDPWTTLADSAANASFTNKEIYIPNYTGSDKKQIKMDYSVVNGTASVSDLGMYGMLFNLSDPITSIKLLNPSVGTFNVGTTANLYGIKNS
jgi:hypothetical protein